MNIEIRDCPFCGKRPSINVEQTEISQAIGVPQFRVRIDCQNDCNVHPFLGPFIFLNDEEICGNADKTRNEAVKLWNERP